jgi:hypothetical protein
MNDPKGGCMYNKPWLQSGLIIGVMSLLSACLDGPSFFGKDNKVFAVAMQTSVVDGVMSTSFDPNSTVAQTMSSGDVDIIFQPGTFPFAVDMTLEDGESFVTNALAVDLGMPGNNFSAASKALVLQAPGQSVKANVEFTLGINLGATLAFQLNNATKNYAVACLYQDPDKGLILTIIPADKVRIQGNKALFETVYFGAYQIIETAVRIVTAPIPIPSPVAILTKKAANQLEPMVFTIKEVVFETIQADKGVFWIDLEFSGSERLTHASFFVYDALTGPFKYGDSSKGDDDIDGEMRGGYVDIHYPLSDTTQSVYVQLEIRDEKSRNARTQRFGPIAVPKKQQDDSSGGGSSNTKLRIASHGMDKAYTTRWLANTGSSLSIQGECDSSLGSIQVRNDHPQLGSLATVSCNNNSFNFSVTVDTNTKFGSNRFHLHQGPHYDSTIIHDARGLEVNEISSCTTPFLDQRYNVFLTDLSDCVDGLIGSTNTSTLDINGATVISGDGKKLLYTNGTTRFPAFLHIGITSLVNPWDQVAIAHLSIHEQVSSAEFFGTSAFISTFVPPASSPSTEPLLIYGIDIDGVKLKTASNDTGLLIGSVSSSAGNMPLKIQDIRISNVQIYTTGTAIDTFGGLIGGQHHYNTTISNTLISNLTMSNCSYNCGGLIGNAAKAKLYNVGVNGFNFQDLGTVTSASGGLIGYGFQVDTISDSFAKNLSIVGPGTLPGVINYFGGLVGKADGDMYSPGMISQSYAHFLSVTNPTHIRRLGGIIGNAMSYLNIIDVHAEVSFSDFSNADSISNFIAAEDGGASVTYTNVTTNYNGKCTSAIPNCWSGSIFGESAPATWMIGGGANPWEFKPNIGPWHRYIEHYFHE